MKIFLNELYKLITAPIFVFMLAAAVLITLYSTFVTAPVSVDGEAYKAFFAEISTISDSGEQAAFVENKLAEERKTTDFSFERANRMRFLQAQAEQARQIADYQTYLENIDSYAESMTSVSIFGDKNSFTYKNIVATPAAYDSVRTVTPVFSPSAGVLLALNNRAADFTLLFVLIAAAVVLIGRERESGIIGLIKPLKHGRSHLCFAKIGAIFTASLLTGAVLFAGMLTIGELRFGLGDLSRPVQSLEGYIGCNLPISVWQMLLSVFVIKILAAFIITVIFQCLCTKLSATVSMLCLLGLAAAEVAMYLLIPFSSAFSALSAINLAAFMDSGAIFSTYRCINLFGFPVNYLAVTIACLAVSLAAVIVVALRLFSHMSISASGKLRIAMPFSGYIPKRAFTYTAYKFLFLHKGLLIIAAVTAIQMYSAANYQVPYSADEGHYKAYCATLSGMDDSEARSYIAAEQDKFDTLTNLMLSPEVTAGEIQQISRELNPRNGFNKAKNQYDYIAALSSDNKAMFYLTGWNELFGVNGNQADMQLALIAVAALCLMILPVLAYDRKCRLGFLLYATKSGKRAYFKRKMLAAALLGILTSLTVYIPYIVSVLSNYGAIGYDKSIRCLQAYEHFPDIPIWGYLILLLAARAALILFLSAVLLWISSLSRSPSAAILIGFALFALPILIYLAGYDFALPFCVPLGVNYLWLDFGPPVAVNLAVTLAAGAGSSWAMATSRQ
jgi:hypothetical protein